MSKLVRIAPYNPRRGYVRQRHTIIHPKPMRFDESRGWYEVDDEIAASLAEIPQEDTKPWGLKTFMIADDVEHAKALEAALAEATRERDHATVGTVEAPVRAARPGAKRPVADAAATGADTAPRTRRRK